jgi:hypothetical protein
MPSRRRRFELVHQSERAGSRTVARFGPVRLTLVAALASLALALLFVGALGLPARLSTWRQAKEMDVLVARRAQQGERLRALALRFEQLEQQTAANEERVQRVRRLYGLAELPATARFARPPRPVVDTVYSAALLHVARLELRVEEMLARTDSLIATLASWEREHADEAATVPARLPLRGILRPRASCAGRARRRRRRGARGGAWDGRW